MNFGCLAIAFVLIVGGLIWWDRSEQSRLDQYVLDCRKQGGWAVSAYWPNYKGWVQCMRADVISLPQDAGAKP